MPCLFVPLVVVSFAAVVFRVHTLMLPVLSELSELYRAADGAATVCLLAKLGVEKSLLAKLEDTRQALLVRQAIRMLCLTDAMLDTKTCTRMEAASALRNGWAMAVQLQQGGGDAAEPGCCRRS